MFGFFGGLVAVVADLPDPRSVVLVLWVTLVLVYSEHYSQTSVMQ